MKKKNIIKKRRMHYETTKPKKGSCQAKGCHEKDVSLYSHGCSLGCHFCAKHYYYTITYKYCYACFSPLDDLLRPLYKDFDALSLKRKKYLSFCPSCKKSTVDDFPKTPSWKCPSCSQWICSHCKTLSKHKTSSCENSACVHHSNRHLTVKLSGTGFLVLHPRQCSYCHLFLTNDKDCHMMICPYCTKHHPSTSWLCGQCGDSSATERHQCTNFKAHLKIPGGFKLNYENHSY
mmetsp:Transcript_3610/g.5330  ORF Transcript_3610/g.5330 Transcript_3610/m.5330 type:complete len:233 (+) Transcript_3610:2515-3213(+)